MNKLDEQLKELYKQILSKQRMKTDITNVGIKSIFGYQIKLNIEDGLPLTTLRDIDTKTIIHELLWFLGSYDEKYKKFGNTNIKYLVDNDIIAWSDFAYDKYKEEKLKIYLNNDLKNSKEVKKFKFLSHKDFLKKIKKDDDFALKYGELGSIHSKQWKDWGGTYELVEKTNNYKEMKSDTLLVDKLGWEKIYLKGINQIENSIKLLINEPDSTRNIINSWNVSELEDLIISNNHVSIQFYSEILEMEERINYCEKNSNFEDIKLYMKQNDIEDWSDIRRNPIKQIKILERFNVPERKLSMKFNMSSTNCDILPYNILSYSILLHMISQIVDMVPYELIYDGGDIHIYSNTIKRFEEQLQKESNKLPLLKLNKLVEDIYDFRFEDFEIIKNK